MKAAGMVTDAATGVVRTGAIVAGASIGTKIVENFDVFAHAAGGVDRLRDLVIELALQGRLVEQRQSDEPAQKLVDRARQALDIKFDVDREVVHPQGLPPGWVSTSPREIGQLPPPN